MYDRNKKLVEILRAVCICDGKSMRKNQAELTRKLLSNEEVRKKLLLGIEKRGTHKGAIFIEVDFSEKNIASSMFGNQFGPNMSKSQFNQLERQLNQDGAKGFGAKNNRDAFNPNAVESDDEKAEGVEWIKLKDLDNESKIRDDSKFYEFYTKFILLLSDLCQERNYNAIELLRSYFSVDICIECITDSMYPLKIRSSFCKLMENLWIDVTPFMKLTIPSNIKNWRNIESEILIKGSDKI